MNTLKTKRKSATTQRKTVALIFKDYCKNCSLHGFFYFYKSNSPLVHFVWSIIILGSILLCAYLNMMIFRKFVIDPTLTVVESTHYPMSEVAFPAVTICDPEVVYGPNTKNLTKILTSRGFNSSEVEDFYQSFKGLRYGDYKPSHVRKMHEVLDDLNLPYNTLLNLLKKPCDVMIVTCTWRSKLHNCSSMFRELFLISQYCCQFDMNYFQLNAEDNTNFISGIQVNEALDVLVDGKKHFPNGSSEEGHLLLYVFDEQDTITFLDNYVSITPATFFDINVDVWMIDSSDYVKDLDVKSRGCILKSDPTYGTGFYHGCMTAVVMRHVSEFCRCLPYHTKASDLNVEIRKTCSWEQLTCIYDTKDKVLGNMRSVIAESECYQRCDYVQYDTNVKYVRHQRRYNDISEGQSSISVHFDDDICLKYRREVLYTWDQVLDNLFRNPVVKLVGIFLKSLAVFGYANLGGIFGLCLGGSVISIIELVWFLFDLIFNATNNYFKGKVEKKKVQNLSNSTEISTIKKDFVGNYTFNN